MSEPNFAGNIIVNLASLPDFLRTPILKKRMTEFFSKNQDDKSEIIVNALNAGPTIPFPNFSKLFKTWLEVLATINNENREDMFSNYFRHILISPEKIILFNLDAIFEIFLQIDKEKQKILISSIKIVFDKLDEESKRKMILLTPDSARILFNF
ncbi:MAG: hypothetical protein HN875_02270 [Candidatus Nitrosopelagicus sp.]|jgi:hypothetical protein|nr:hypothetical protein [Candidatus Nitrosopelagicus sp.]|tara:strand:- start:598 stop:1059 length:462 start_codon:yes stop_codon:yes gene_type:complete